MDPQGAENAENSQTRLRKLRVGYVPYSPDSKGPGDRRRFCFYARRREIEYETYVPGHEYDLIVLSSLADLTYFSRLPRNDSPLLVYDIVDSYLQIPSSEIRALIRGPAKYLLGQHSHLEWSYHVSIRRMATRADAIACSTPEQLGASMREFAKSSPHLEGASR